MAGTTFHVQNGITFNECSEITDNSLVMAWLTFEVLAFYINLAGCVAFLAVASFKSFRTFRERAGFQKELRKNQDYLVYCKDDIHWF